MAATEPEIVCPLVLEEPAVDFSEADSSKPFLQIIRNLAASGHSYEKIKLLLRPLMKDTLSSFSLSSYKIKGELGNIPVPIPRQDEPLRLAELRGEAYITLTAKCIHALDPEVMDFLIDARAYEGYNVEEFFKQVVCPTLFLQGNPSLMGTTGEVARHGVSLVRNCKHVYVENAGHNLHRTQPETVVKVVEEFLAPRM